MSTTSFATLTPISAHQLYRKMVKKVHVTQPVYKQLLKKQINSKFQKHMTLLQSHRNRELRFQENFTTIQKRNEQRSKQKVASFHNKEEKIRESRENFLSEKKKRMSNNLTAWQSTVQRNHKRYINKLQQSKTQIKKWNEKCEDSISKKNERLHTISSNLSQKSRILQARANQYLQHEHERLLEKVVLLNPQQNIQSKSRSKSKAYQLSQSSLSRCSKISTELINQQRIQKGEKQKLGKFLERLLKKESKIIQARNKKNQLISKVRENRHDKEIYIGQLHQRNNHYLSNQRADMESKLDAKYLQDRKKRKEVNKSLPVISAKLSKLSPRSDFMFKQGIFNTGNIKQPSIRTIQPNYNRLINQELRNISLVSKMRKCHHRN